MRGEAHLGLDGGGNHALDLPCLAEETLLDLEVSEAPLDTALALGSVPDHVALERTPGADARGEIGGVGSEVGRLGRGEGQGEGRGAEVRKGRGEGPGPEEHMQEQQRLEDHGRVLVAQPQPQRLDDLLQRAVLRERALDDRIHVLELSGVQRWAAHLGLGARPLGLGRELDGLLHLARANSTESIREVDLSPTSRASWTSSRAPTAGASTARPTRTSVRLILRELPDRLVNCVKAKQRRALAVAQTADLNALAALPSGSGKKRQLDAGQFDRVPLPPDRV